MGTITPKGTGKNKTYTARAWWTDLKGNRKSKQESGFTTQAAAQSWIDETEDNNQGLAFPDAHKLTVEGLSVHWIDHLRKMKRSPKTIQCYEDNLAKILNHIGPVLVQELQNLHIQNMLDILKEKPIEVPVRKSKLPPEKRYLHNKGKKSSAKAEDEKIRRLPRSATIISVYRTLRAMINYSIKIGVRKYNPCIGVDLPKPQKHISHIYSGDDLANLMTKLKEQNHILYIPVILTVPYALRKGEALAVTWDTIDFDNKCIRIERSWTSVKGMSFLKGVKTESSDDTIAINDWTCQELRSLQKLRFQMEKMTKGETPKDDIVYEKDIVVSDFVCWDENGKLFRPDGMVGRLQRFQKANGLPLCTWHDLRHTYGTLMVEDGVDIVTVSKAMRHSSVKITSDQYIESTMTIKKRATAAFDNLVNMPITPTEQNEAITEKK